MSDCQNCTLTEEKGSGQDQKNICLIIESDHSERMLLSECANKHGFDVFFCDNLLSCSMVQRAPDTVLFGERTDVASSKIVHSEIARLIRERFIPVLVHGKQKDVFLDLFDDVHVYYDKDTACEMLLPLVTNYASRRIVSQGRLLEINGIHQFKFKTLEEAQILANSIAKLAPERTLVRLAVTELLVNAVEHGNLNINNDEKILLRAQGQWMEEVQRRLLLPPYRDRQVTVHIEKNAFHVHLKIEDQGQGFDWQSYLELIKEVPKNKKSGRGVKIAFQAGFDLLRYIGCGNVVECSFSLQENKTMGLGKILCVEYETRTRSELCRMLRNAGYETCEASTVEDGLNIIRTQSLDLVLCDIKLPDLDGFALINKVRTGNGPWSAVPFVFLTSLSGREDLLEGFRLGADDYLAKPVDAEMLLVRISAMLRQNKRVIKVVHDHHLDLQKELERAHNMQRDLLPSRETERVLERAYNIRLTSHYEPSSQLGGDIWGVQLISNNKFMFYLVDFSGHGVSAALNTFRLHSKIDSEPITSESPAQYLQGLNIWLCDHLPTGQYATTLLGIVDFSQRKFEYAAAGSTSPMRVNSKMRSVETGSGKGLPLGVSKKAVYENRTLDFCPGDGIFLYSDALVEHGRKDHMDLGREGVEQLVLNVADMSGDLIVDDILAPFLAMAPRPLSDDLTAVCCVWKVMS